MKKGEENLLEIETSMLTYKESHTEGSVTNNHLCELRGAVSYATRFRFCDSAYLLLSLSGMLTRPFPPFPVHVPRTDFHPSVHLPPTHPFPSSADLPVSSQELVQCLVYCMNSNVFFKIWKKEEAQS